MQEIGSPQLLILGAGYVGRQLLAAAPNALGTRRTDASLGPREFVFDLANPATWEHLDAAQRHVVWTFPATPPDLVERFFEAKLKQAASLIVLGSTSAYKVTRPDQLIDEDAPLDLSQPRVVGEEWLRTQGATILQLAGIFGPAREPVDWLKKGLIKNGLKRVNLIHVADIVQVIQALARSPKPGLRLNLSNGQVPAWKDLVEIFQQRGLLSPDFVLPEAVPGSENKLIDSGRLRALFPAKEWLTP